MKRRYFLTALSAIFPTTIYSMPSLSGFGNNDILSDDFPIPNFCGHEHWGSVFSMPDPTYGFTPDIKAGAIPGKTNLIHLLAEPYFAGNLIGSGTDPWKIKRENESVVNLFVLAENSIQEAVHLFHKISKSNSLTGPCLATETGIKALYGVDINIAGSDGISQLNLEVQNNYSSLFQWYRKGMKKMNFTELIRPVHPEFYFNTGSAKATEELSFTRTVLRIDSLLDYWKDSERRKDLFEKLSLEAYDASSWKKLLIKLFDYAKENGCIGIKQMQAYFRDLNFENPSENIVKFSGELDNKEKTIFENWMVNECCKLANDIEWPHQVHVGTHNMPNSNPLPLQQLAVNYPKQKLVQLHCWPYQREAGFLAKTHPNIYIDTCWQVILNPEFLKESLRQWINYVPLSKITMSNDSTTIEMAAGSKLIGENILSGALDEQSFTGKINDVEKMSIMYDFMHNNSVDIYKVNEKIFYQT